MSGLTEKAKRAVDEMFRDTSCPQSETADNLRDIIDHCTILLDTLDEKE